MSIAYVGCRTTKERNARGKGISVYKINDATGEWKLVQTAESKDNPSWLGFDHTGEYLYTVHGDFYEVSSYKVDKTGKLSYMGTSASGGKNPVFLMPDKTNRFVYVATLQGGAVSVLERKEDGSLSDPVFQAHLEGLTKEGLSHAHQCQLDRTGNWLLVPTQGRKKGYGAVFVFKTFEDGSLKQVQRFDIGDDQEPRHLVCSIDNKTVYVLNEKGSTISVLKFDDKEGKLESVGMVSTLPGDYKGESQAGEILIQPDGKYIYATNRTHDSICVFAIRQDGMPEPIQWISSRGKIPRFMGMGWNGTKLFAANEETDTIEIFNIARESGKLSWSGVSVATGSPVCVVIKDTRLNSYKES